MPSEKTLKFLLECNLMTSWAIIRNLVTIQSIIWPFLFRSARKSTKFAIWQDNDVLFSEINIFGQKKVNVDLLQWETWKLRKNFKSGTTLILAFLWTFKIAPFFQFTGLVHLAGCFNGYYFHSISGVIFRVKTIARNILIKTIFIQFCLQMFYTLKVGLQPLGKFGFRSLTINNEVNFSHKF